MRKTQQLTALQVAKVKVPGRYGDGLGLWLQVAQGGTKSWLFRFQRAGQARQMGLGPVHTVTLADARLAAQDARKQLLSGKDPIETRKAAAAATARAEAGMMTFKEAAQAYIEAHARSWKNQVHARQWPSSLEAYAYPVLGKLAVAAIDTAAVMKVLEGIWRKKTDTAGRVRGRIELILDWAKARGYRDGDNPARWRGHLDKLLPAKSRVQPTQHHPALPYRDLPKFMADLRKRDGVAARCLEFTILNVTRTNESIGAKRSEINEKLKLWTVPPARMKSGREHRIPLAQRSMAIIKKLPREKDWLFIGAREDKALSNMAMLKVLEAMGRADLTVHGFRSTFRDWAAETTNFPREVCEMALAHAVGDDVERAYRRGDLFEKRRKLAEAWAAFCGRAK